MSVKPTVRDLVQRGQSLAALPWRVIDAHGHLGPTGGFYIPTPDAVSMVALMDRVGIAMTGISSHLAITSDYARGNDLTAQAVRGFPGRFFGYVVANPHYRDKLLGELERGFDQLGLVAIKVHSTLHDFAVGDPICEPIWRFAEARHALVLGHSWEGDPRCSPEAFGEVAGAHSRVRFLLGHRGGTPAGRRASVDVAREHDNVYLELCGSTITSAEISWMVDQIGPERVIFGTDSPWIDPRFLLGKLAFADLADEAWQSVMGGNIERLLSR